MGWDDVNTDQTTTTTTGFNQCYLSYPFSHISKTNHETGNKIILPASALDQLASLTITYPMLFRIENPSTGLHSHCGVIEFTADEGFVFLPTWMMNNMQLQEGELVNIKNTSLPKGTYIKIQPHETKFTTLSDHKYLLEKTFRDITCLTTGDTIVVKDNDEMYMIDIVETKPSHAILLFETDCEVDFARPLDYKVPEKKPSVEFKRKSEGNDVDRTIRGFRDEEDATKKDCKLFPGAGRRLGGTHVHGDDKCLLSSDLSMKKLKLPESTTVDVGKLEEKHEVAFKVFNGVARRVDGQPLEGVAVDEMVRKDHSKIY